MLTSRRACSLTAACLLIAFCGCTRVQTTPAGRVEPASSSSPPTAATQQTDMGVVWQPPKQAMSAESLQQTVDEFANAYARAGSPRIALFLNRSMSDPVPQWSSGPQLMITGAESETETGPDGDRKRKLNYRGTLGVVDSDANRPTPDEQWMWAFENGMLQPLLAANAKVVDRALIVGLAASDTAEESNSSLGRIEVQALKDHADILIESLVSRSPSSPCGYEFKLSAKDVATGQVIANVTSLRWGPDYPVRRPIVATAEGYEVGNWVPLPSVEDAAAILSADLMNALIQRWQVQ